MSYELIKNEEELEKLSQKAVSRAQQFSKHKFCCQLKKYIHRGQKTRE
jgi:hypothetical protein